MRLRRAQNSKLNYLGYETPLTHSDIVLGDWYFQVWTLLRKVKMFQKFHFRENQDWTPALSQARGRIRENAKTNLARLEQGFPTAVYLPADSQNRPSCGLLEIGSGPVLSTTLAAGGRSGTSAGFSWLGWGP